MSKRLFYNLQILRELEQYLIQNPEQRFNQALVNMGITSTVMYDEGDGYHFRTVNEVVYAEEPEAVIERVFNTIKPLAED